MPEPASAPSAPPSAAVPIETAAAAVQTPTTTIPDFYESLKTLVDKQDPPPKKEDAPPEKPEETPPPEDKEPAKTDKPPEQTKPADTKDKAPPKPTDKKEPVRATEPKELRRELDRLKGENSKLATELETLKKAKPPEDPEKGQLLEFAKSAQARIQKLTEQLGFAAYEQTDEYKERYEKPYIDAYTHGRSKAAQLKVVERKNEDGDVTQQGRAATAADFDSIMRIQDDYDAADKAEQMFGPAAKVVLYHRERVQELNQKALDAIADFRKTGSERKKQFEQQRAVQTADMAKQQKARAERFQTLNAEAEKSYPQWFAEVEGDEAGNEALKKGRQISDLAFSDPNNVEAHSALRMRSAAFDRLVLQLNQSKKQIAELTKELEALKGSEPGGGTAKRQTPKEKTVDDMIDELAAQNV